MDHIIAITGIRRCGKSYLLKQIADFLLGQGVRPENIVFINFEMPGFVGSNAHEILDEMLNNYKKYKNPQGRLYLFFDEIHILNEWEVWIKYQYDMFKGQVKFFITGYNSQLLSGDLATLLTGRIIEKTLFPFSFTEILEFQKISFKTREDRVLNKAVMMSHFDDYLVNGGMPELMNITNHETRRDVLASYFNAIIYRDIIPRFSVRESELLNALAVYLLGHSSNLIKINKIAEYFKVNRKTVREFIRFLQGAFLITMISKFDYKPKTQALSLKKCYIADNGFISYLSLKFSPNKGMMLENLVFSELKKRFENIFHWKNNTECDFIGVDHSGNKFAIQVCHTMTPDNRDREIKGLSTVMRMFEIDNGMILTYNQKEALVKDQRNISIKPIFEWLFDKEL